MISGRNQGVILQHPNMQKEAFNGKNVAGRLGHFLFTFVHANYFVSEI
jgi:hypothetical protein